MLPSCRFRPASLPLLFGFFFPVTTLFLTLVSAVEPTAAASAAPASLTLEEAERLAQEASPALKAAAARVQIEEGRKVQAGIYPNPDLTLDSTWFTSNHAPKEWILSLRQPLPWHGKRGMATQEAMERIESARRDQERQRLDLLFDVRETYYRAYFGDQVVRIEQENLDATVAMKKAVDSRVAAGDAAPFEALKASVEVKRAEGRLALARGEAAARMTSFLALMGLPADRPTDLSEPKLPAEPEENLSLLQEKALAAEPEIQSKHHLALAAGFATRRARLEPRPDIAVGPVVGREEGESFVGAGIALILPLWNHNRGGIASAVAAEQEAAALEDAARLSVTRLVAETYASYRSAILQRQFYEDGLLSQTEDLLRNAQQAYEGGETGILEMLDARRTALSVREEYYRAALDAALASLRLKRSLGEDSEASP